MSESGKSDVAPSLFRKINLVKQKLKPQLKIVLHYEERNSCSWFPSFVQVLASGRGRLNPLVLMVGATSCITELPNTLHFARARERGRGATAGDSITFKQLLEVAVEVAAATRKKHLSWGIRWKIVLCLHSLNTSRGQMVT